MGEDVVGRPIQPITQRVDSKLLLGWKGRFVVKSLVVLTGDLGSVPSTQVAVHKHP